MSILAGKQYKVKQSGKEYVFGVCKSAAAPCLEETGICRIDNGQTTSLGVVSSHLQLNGSGTPFLSYKSGSVCKNIKSQWTTRIEFICSWKDYIEAVVVENTDCEIVIHFLTVLACADQVRHFVLNLEASNCAINHIINIIYYSKNVVNFLRYSKCSVRMVDFMSCVQSIRRNVGRFDTAN